MKFSVYYRNFLHGHALFLLYHILPQNRTRGKVVVPLPWQTSQIR